ncbi:5504_t:CDS:1 [Dentiscutata erythropus]|uniref:5504_t:CDS:1 n=1 Tax=Dentiscutata erythropus TaxID=1348616 RepID=A0A9N9IEM9_9GLOM|nr:5504_t:CDS:1 [Dentiscutata erythropus]
MTMTQQQEIHPTIYISPMTAAPPQDMKQSAVVKHLVPHPLTADCIEEVLNHLLDSSGSLYSCALVNRLWNHLAIPLLWYHPFGNKLHDRKARILFETYISCFPDDKKNMLSMKRPHFPIQRPLFHYPKYLRGFDWGNFQFAIKEWFSTMPQHHDLNTKLQSSKFFIANYLLGRCSGLRVLRIEPDASTKDNKFLDLVSLSNFRFIFSKLEKLEIQFDSCCENWLPSLELIALFATKLSICSRNIQHISIADKNSRFNSSRLPSYICEALWQLIKAQTNLITLEIHEFWNPERSELFYDALESQARSLKFLSISHISQFHLLLPTLTSCTNLETLEFRTVPDTNMETLLYTKDSTSQLSIKKLLCYDFKGDPRIHRLTLGIVIFMTNQHLRELYLPVEVRPELLDVICQYCPNLVNLHLVLTTPLLLKILPYISTLPLKSLALFDKDKSSFPIELIQQVAQSFPPTLCNLEINFHMTSQGLQYFLGNCRGSLKKLVIHNKTMNDQYLAVVAHYAKVKKSLKIFMYDGKFSEEMLDNARIWIPFIENVQ